MDEKEYFDLKHIKLQTHLVWIAIIFPVATFFTSAIFNVITLNKTQKVEVMNLSTPVDSITTNQKLKSLNMKKSKIDSLTKTKSDSINKVTISR